MIGLADDVKLHQVKEVAVDCTVLHGVLGILLEGLQLFLGMALIPWRY